jgi:hypothetical protein
VSTFVTMASTTKFDGLGAKQAELSRSLGSRGGELERTNSETVLSKVAFPWTLI